MNSGDFTSYFHPSEGVWQQDPGVTSRGGEARRRRRRSRLAAAAARGSPPPPLGGLQAAGRRGASEHRPHGSLKKLRALWQEEKSGY